jgi:hypothetical protein
MFALSVMGNTTFESWLILWFLLTRKNCKIPVAANSQDQLRDTQSMASLSGARQGMTGQAAIRHRREGWLAVRTSGTVGELARSKNGSLRDHYGAFQ